MLDTLSPRSYDQALEVRLSPEREAQLNDYAARPGQDSATALDTVLAEALAWEKQDYQDALEGIRQGYLDSQNGRVRSIAASFQALRVKHDLPG